MIIGRIIFIVVLTLIGYSLGVKFLHPWIGFIVGIITSALMIGIEFSLKFLSSRILVLGGIGLVCGLIIANLLVLPLLVVHYPLVKIIWLPLNLVLGYTGILIGIKKLDDKFFQSLFLSKEEKEEKLTTPFKILDSSVIIDGRFIEVYEAGFLEGIFILPRFILHEIQKIADSSDSLRRNRGRRGLNILNKLQKDPNAEVELSEMDFSEIKEVDAKLVKLAKVIHGKILTNDYNLNKVAELEGVKVLNINELAEALKPVVLPGEEMVIHIIKEGKEFNQGVGYLEDGTMVVVEEGMNYIGRKITVSVSSVLQSTAGRMIFAKYENNRRQ